MADQHTSHSRSHDLSGKTTPREPVPRIDSEAIFDGRDAVVLVHGGQEYLLRITRNGKLILNK